MKIRRLFSLGIIALATVLVLTLGSGVASAADFCRGDPIFYLSNGKTLLVDVRVDDISVDQLSRIDYRVSLPKNVWLLPVPHPLLPPGVTENPEKVGPFPELAAKEFVRYSGNTKENEYRVDVKVTPEKKIRDGVVTIYAVIGYGRPVWVPKSPPTFEGEGHWEWPTGTILQGELTVTGKVEQTIHVRLFAD